MRTWIRGRVSVRTFSRSSVFAECTLCEHCYFILVAGPAGVILAAIASLFTQDMTAFNIVSLVVPPCILTGGFIKVLSLHGTNDLCIQLRTTFVGKENGLSILCEKFETDDAGVKQALGVLYKFLGLGTCCKGRRPERLLRFGRTLYLL